MPYKFKIGDVVKITRILGYGKRCSDLGIRERDWIENNRKGKVVEIRELLSDNKPYIYRVSCKGRSPEGRRMEYFSSRELELVEDQNGFKQIELLEKIKQLWERQDYVRSRNV